MNQFKSIFLGNEIPEKKRVVNSQKCIRVSGKHNDLEEVGLDKYHHTFFEMMGNWSFGDYYKEEAISWAWELLTKEWEIDQSRLWATIYDTDDESFDIWKKIPGIPENRILRFGKKFNLGLANGGDQNNDICPEKDVCDKYKIELIDGLGDKIRSSSDLTGLK